MKFWVIFEPAGEQLYCLRPNLPGCVSQGAKKEVLRNIKKTIELYLKVAEELKLNEQCSR